MLLYSYSIKNLSYVLSPLQSYIYRCTFYLLTKLNIIFNKNTHKSTLFFNLLLPLCAQTRFCSFCNIICSAH